MPTPPDDVPWLAWAIVVVILALIAQIPVMVQLRKARKGLEVVASDIAATKEQTVNEHAGAEYPNLRDELTAIRTDTAEALNGIRSDIGGVHSEVRDVRDGLGHVRDDITGIRSDARQDRRRIAALERRGA